jgi:Xaa-Pro dipeptidase
MITAEGCQARRSRLLERFPAGALLADPLHLRYFANCHIDPFSLGADYFAILQIKADGSTTLFHDGRLPKSAEDSHVDERVVLKWYDGKSAGIGPRRTMLQKVFQLTGIPLTYDDLSHPDATNLWDFTTQTRRRKDADEVAQLRECMRVTEAGHTWAREHVEAGMTELDVYNGIFAACCKAAGKPVIVYGDFAVSSGSARRGGMATSQVLKNGDMLILDFSVVLQGYRSDFTNTLCVGKSPTAEQQQLFDYSLEAMKVGESLLKAGANCLAVYQAVRCVFERHGVAQYFPHHAGHGLGISHPEAPFFVENASESLVAGDVVTLEPGLYIDGVGGLRIEHNYLITDTGYEQLSHHHLGLV